MADLGQIVDNSTIKIEPANVPAGGVLHAVLAELVDGETIFVNEDGKLTANKPSTTSLDKEG